MKEFLRNNAKAVMTVISIGLMLVFALPTMKPHDEAFFKGQEIGRLDGRKVTQGELSTYTSELERLKRLPGFRRFQLTSQVLSWASEDNQNNLWFLLCQESAKYAHSYISFNEALDYAGVTESDVINMQLSQDQFTAMVSRVLTVEDYIRMFLDMPQPVAQVELMGDRDYRTAAVTLTDIDGAAGWKDAAIPTEEKIKAQFDAYKSVLPSIQRHMPLHDNDGRTIVDITPTEGAPNVRVRTWSSEKPLYDGPWDKAHKAGYDRDLIAAVTSRVGALVAPIPLPKEIGGHFYPFGYRIPDRAQVEWLVLKRADIRKLTQPTQPDIDAAFKFFTEHPDRLPPPPETAPATSTAPATTPASAPAGPSTTTAAAATVAASAPATGSVAATTTAPATAPAVASAPSPETAPAASTVRTWKDVSKQLIDAQIDDRVNKQMGRMLNQISTRTQAPWKTATPPKSLWVNYEQLAKEFAPTQDFNGYTPEHHVTDGLRNEQELGDLPGIGEAYAQQGERIFAFHSLAVRVKENVTLDKTDPATRLNLMVGADGPVLRDVEGNIYVYRVINAEAAHDPASLDATVNPGVTVRGEVVDDLKKAATYEARLQEFESLLTKSSDLSTVADHFKARILAPDPFTRSQAANGDLPLEVAGIRDFADTAFALQEPTAGVPSPLGSIKSDEVLQLTAIHLVHFTPATAQDFSVDRFFELRDRHTVVRPDPQVSDLVQQYFDYKTMATRMKFEAKKNN